MTTEEYGIADLVFTTSQLIIPIVSIVIWDAIIRFGLMKDRDREEVLKVGVTVGVVGALVTVAVTPLFHYYTAIAPWKWYLCIYVILSYSSTISMSYLKIKDQNKSYAIISILQTFTLALINVLLLVVFRVGIRGYLIANIVAVGTSLILAILSGKALKTIICKPLNRLLLLEMVKYSSPLILNDLSWWVIHSSDKYMIEAMINSSSLGIFTAATKIPALINVIINIFGQAWNISSIKEMDSSNDVSFYSKVFEGYTFLAFGSCVFLIAVLKPFMSVYVGNAFHDSWLFVPMLLVSAVFSAVASYFGQMYSALKKPVNNMLSTLSAALVNILVNYLFILKVGAWGAVIGTVVAYVILALLRMLDVSRYIKIQINNTQFFANCLIVMLQGILVSIGRNIYIVSAACAVCFLTVNYTTLKLFYRAISRKIKT